MRRLTRNNAYIGRNRYFVTVNVCDRQPVFTDAQLVETCRDQVTLACRATTFSVIAACYMPDHLHLLLEGLTASADLRTCVKALKQRTSYRARAFQIRRLWQPGYHERILRQDEDLAGYVAYIVNNPVRAGFVLDPATRPDAYTQRRP